MLIARPAASSSYLTEDARFILTDYQLAVDEVLRGGGVAAGTTTTDVRPGGELAVGGRTVRATHSAYPPLELRRRYILFADRIPGSAAFKIAGGDTRLLDTLEIRDGVHSLGPQGLHELMKTREGARLDAVRAIVRNAACAAPPDARRRPPDRGPLDEKGEHGSADQPRHRFCLRQEHQQSACGSRHRCPVCRASRCAPLNVPRTHRSRASAPETG